MSALSAWNGANFNHVRESVLEAMVRYKFRAITCSIDGASSKVYERYRVNGDFGRVIDNIRKLNAHKRRWKSRYPKLCWQMVVFGHNEHEIDAARGLATELGMSFGPEDQLGRELFPRCRTNAPNALWRRSPGRDLGRSRRASIRRICHQLWTSRRSTSTGRCSAAA